MSKGKSWQERFSGARPPHVSVLANRFAGVPAGGRLFVAAPPLLDAWIALIPPGETRSIEAFRTGMAADHGADATCPASTAIFLRVVAECACERMAGGQAPSEVTPFWRVVEPGGALAARLSCGADFIATQRALESRPTDRPAG